MLFLLLLSKWAKKKKKNETEDTNITSYGNSVHWMDSFEIERMNDETGLLERHAHILYDGSKPSEYL